MKIIFQFIVVSVFAITFSGPIQSMQPCPEGQHLDEDGVCVSND